MDSAENSILIEQSGEGWSFQMEITHVPEYLILTLSGKPSPAQTATFLTLLETHSTQFTNSQGRYYPMIINLMEVPPPSMDGLKAARAMAEGIQPKQSYLVFLVNPALGSAALFGVLLGVMARLMPGRFAVARSMEEAVAEIRAYHQRMP